MAYAADASNQAIPPDYGWLLQYVPAELRALKARMNNLTTAATILASPRDSMPPVWGSSNINLWNESANPIAGPLRYVSGNILTASGLIYYGTRAIPSYYLGYVPANSGTIWLANSAQYGTEYHMMPAGFSATGGFDVRAAGYTGNLGVYGGFSIPGCKNYIWECYDPSAPTAQVAMVTPVPQQIGQYYKQCQSYLDMQSLWQSGSIYIADHFGNYWTPVGNAQLQTAKTWTGLAYALGGLGTGSTLTATDGYKTTAFTSMYPIANKGWTMQGMWYVQTVPTAGAFAAIGSMVNAAGFGVQVGLYNNAGTANFAVNISSDGATANLAAAATARGSLAVVAGNWYAWELTYDDVAGFYRLYTCLYSSTSSILQQDWSLSSAAVQLPITRTVIGGDTTATAITGALGVCQNFEFMPYCWQPAANTAQVFAPQKFFPYCTGPTAFVNANGYPMQNCVMAVPWFDTVGYTWMIPTLPPLSDVRVGRGVPLGFPWFQQDTTPGAYVGCQIPNDLSPSIVSGTMKYGRLVAEFVLNSTGTTASAVINYSFERKYVSLPTTLATVMTFNHNMGVRPGRVSCWLENIQPELSYSIGDRVFIGSIENGSTNNLSISSSGLNKLVVAMTVTAFTIANQSSGAATAITPANWKLIVFAEAGIW